MKIFVIGYRGNRSNPMSVLLKMFFIKLSDFISFFFRTLTGIPGRTESLNLANNQIETLDGGDLWNLPLLRDLNLRNNKVRKIVPGSMSTLRNLEVLNLKGNLITYLNKTTFEGLVNVKEIDLDDNRQLQSVPLGTFSNVYYNVPKLVSLSIQRSMVNCSCDIVTVANNFQSRKKSQYGYNLRVTCVSNKGSVDAQGSDMSKRYCPAASESGYSWIFGVIFALFFFGSCIAGTLRELLRKLFDCVNSCLACDWTDRISEMCDCGNSSEATIRQPDIETNYHSNRSPSISLRTDSMPSTRRSSRSSITIGGIASNHPADSTLSVLSDAPPAYELAISGDRVDELPPPPAYEDLSPSSHTSEGRPPPTYEEIASAGSYP